MALPASYTEQTLAAYMVGAIGRLAGVLSLDGGDFFEAVNDTLLDYGVDDVGSATNIRKLRAIARYHAWRAAVAQATGLYDFQADDGRFSKKQVYDQALAGLALAESDALAEGLALLGGGYAVVKGSIAFDGDPYVVDGTWASDE